MPKTPPSLSSAPSGDDDSHSRKTESPSDGVPHRAPLFAQICQKELNVFVLVGLPDYLGELLDVVKTLLSQGVEPLEKVTIDDLLDELGPSKQLRAHLDYLDWDALVIARHWLQGTFLVSSTECHAYFSLKVVCRDDSQQLAEILTCIMIPCKLAKMKFGLSQSSFL